MICLCGSGNSYNECCKMKKNPYESEGSYKGFMSELDLNRRKFRKMCLHPNKGACSRTKTHAHIISQFAVLELIADKSKVLMPIVYGITGEFRLDSMGIESKATKLYCFCQEHDKVFYPIDVRNAEMTSENIFLYAYRSFAGLYYKVIRELECLKKLGEKYDFSENPYVLLEKLNLERLLCWGNWYKDKFDNCLTSYNYDYFESEIITLAYRVYVAAATCLCLEFDLLGNRIVHHSDDLPLIFLSVIPHVNHSKIIFTWLKEDNGTYGFLKEQLKVAPRRLILKYLNNLIPINCENITLSPKLWEEWGESARDEYKQLGNEHLKNQQMKNTSKTYFSERKYNIFMKL